MVVLGINEILSLIFNYSLKTRITFMDELSFLLITLTFLIIFLIIKARYGRVKLLNKNIILFRILIGAIGLFLVLTFLSLRPLIFYIRFEASLIPIFLLIIG